MNKKRLLSLALAGTIGVTTLFAPTAAVQAAPSTVSGLDSLISDLDAEENELSKKIENIQNDIKKNQKDSKKLVAEMKETEALLEELQDEIAELKVAIEKREAHIQEQARALQIVGESGNIVKFVLNAESLNDIVGRVDVVTTLLSSNKQIIAEQEEDKAAVETKEDETIEKQEEQTKLAGKLERNKAALDEKEAEQESLLAKVASDKATAKDKRDDLLAQARAAEQRRQELEEARTASASNNVGGGSVTTASSSSSAAKTKDSTPKANVPKPSGGSAIGIANSLKGIPYVYGGGSTSGFDCSGFTSYVFSQTGRSLPRTAAGQYASTTRISQSQAQPGDLVFFNQGGGVDHVGIYLGGGSFIGAQTSTGVAVSTINSGYWSNYVAGFGR